MLTLRERLAVVNLYEELGSYRAVAAIAGCDHKTVTTWLEREQRGKKARTRMDLPLCPREKSRRDTSG